MLLDMAEVRQGQAEDIRDFLRTRGAATMAEIGAEVVLSEFSVKSRLQEHPDWFRVHGEHWEALP